MEFYSQEEERLNILSHGIGLVLSIAGLVFLLVQAIKTGTFIHVLSYGIFGFSLIAVYGSSTWYHSTKDPLKRQKLRILDHASIFILIAGSYTPFTLITMSGSSIAYLFYLSWTLAAFGIILKIFFTGKFKILSTIMYVLIGSIIFLDVDPLIQNLPINGLNWIMIGGIAYLIGGVLYNLKGLKFNHAIFHVFVMIGSFCHFMAVYFYIL